MVCDRTVAALEVHLVGRADKFDVVGALLEYFVLSETSVDLGLTIFFVVEVGMANFACVTFLDIFKMVDYI